MAMVHPSAFAPMLGRALNPLRAQVWTRSLFSRTALFLRKKEDPSELTYEQRKMREEYEKMARAPLEKHRRLLERRKQKRRLSRVPSCHFLVLNKPEGVTTETVVANAKASADKVLLPALRTRYYGIRAEKCRPGKPKAFRMLKSEYRTVRMELLDRLEKVECGVLVLAIESATKLKKRFREGTKEYEVKAVFGQVENPRFRSGVEKCGYAKVTKESLDDVIKARFIGKIRRNDGRVLFESVRNGAATWGDTQKEQVEIHSFEVLDLKLPEASFRVEVNHGGLVLPAIVDDLARMLGSCASVTEIKRTRYGVFKLEDAFSGVARTLKYFGMELVFHMKHASRFVLGRALDPFELREDEPTAAEAFAEAWGGDIARDPNLRSRSNAPYLPGGAPFQSPETGVGRVWPGTRRVSAQDDPTFWSDAESASDDEEQRDFLDDEKTEGNGDQT